MFQYQFNSPYFEYKCLSSACFIGAVQFYTKHNHVELKTAASAICDLIESGKLVLLK